jgi:hypothetical protein
MPANFTPVFNATSDIVHINITSYIANQPPLMTTPNMLFFTASLGILLLVISALTHEETCNDLTGILAVPFLFLSAIQAFAVDTVNGVGMAQSCIQGTATACNANEWVLIESHTIYHYDLFGVVMAIILLVSLANLYRLWLDYRKITAQEHIGQGPRALDMNEDAEQNTLDEHRGYAEGQTDDNKRKGRGKYQSR